MLVLPDGRELELGPGRDRPYRARDQTVLSLRVFCSRSAPLQSRHVDISASAFQGCSAIGDTE